MKLLGRNKGVEYRLTPFERGIFTGLMKTAQLANAALNEFLADLIKREAIPTESVWDNKEMVFKSPEKPAH